MSAKPSRFGWSSFGRLPRTLAFMCALSLAGSGVTAGIGSGFVGQALAQERRALSEADKTKAKEHYEKATKFFNIQRYSDAIEEYQNVYLITADPNMLVNIAQAHRLNDDLAKAAQAYKRYLTLAPADAEGRPLAERKLAEVEKLIEERKKTGATNPPPAEPAPPPVPPPTVIAPPPVTPTQPIGPPPPPPPPSSPVVVSQSAPPPPASAAGRTPIATWVLLGGGGVLAGAAVGFGLAAKSKSDQVEALGKGSGGRFDPALEKDGQMFNTLTIVSGVAAGAAVAAGVVVFATSRSSGGSASVDRKVATVSPWFWPGGAGAGARMSF